MEQAHEPARRPYAFAWSRHRNPEKEQATLRVWMGALVLLAYLVLRVAPSVRMTAMLAGFIALYVAYGALSLHRRAERWPVRRASGS